MKITQEYEIKIRLKYDAKANKKVKWDYITRNGKLIASYKYNPQKHAKLKELLQTNPSPETITKALKPRPKYIHKAGEYAVYRERREGQRYTTLKKNGHIIWEEPHWGKKAYNHAIENLKEDRTQKFRQQGITIPTTGTTETNWYRSSVVYSYTAKSSDIIDIRVWVHTFIRTNETNTLEQIIYDLARDNVPDAIGFLDKVFEERAEPIHDSETSPPGAPANQYQGYVNIRKQRGGEHRYSYYGPGPGKMTER